MEKKEREQLKERLLKMVVNEPRPEPMPPITMAEVMVNSMSKPNLEPLLDFISQELSKAREEGRREGGQAFLRDTLSYCSFHKGKPRRLGDVEIVARKLSKLKRQ